jgi:hypothetical protein
MAEAEHKGDEHKGDEHKEEIEEDELGIKKLIKEVSEANKKIDDAYDERLKRLEAKKKLLPDEKAEELHQARISGLNEKLKELKARIGAARRSGKDPFIADLMIRNAGAKIKMAEATHEKRDFEEVEKILNTAASELEEALAENELDVKKEIERKLKEAIAKDTGKVTEEE